MPKAPANTASPMQLTIAVYQNGDHVSGILQQAYNQGLLASDTRESGHQGTSTQSRGSHGELNLEAGGDVPFLAKAAGTLGYNRDRGAVAESRQDQRVVTSYQYTEAYYLHHVRTHLQQHALLKPVTGVTQADQLKPGDFVEFQACFQPSQITPFLDILTPDLIAQSFHYRRMRDAASKLNAVEGFDGLEGFDRIKAFAERARMLADADAELARAVTTAVRADFRSEATREYRGLIGGDKNLVTAVTICDAACFLVDDADRLLDGEFTVLGKATSSVTHNVPILARNKLLSRLDEGFVDEALRQLREITQQQVTRLPGGGEAAAQKVFDAGMPSRIEGPSFNVIPIAIYL